MGGEHRRWPRVSQKTASCRVEGCKDICVGNDLCSKHNMALRRYGSIYGKPKAKKICIVCGGEFECKYDKVEHCSKKCYRSVPEHKAKVYQAVKRHRANNLEKIRERDNLGRRTRRRFRDKEVCAISGCDKIGETHHPDYEKPYEIVWLCKGHHKAVEFDKVDFGLEDIRCDVIWKEMLDLYGVEHLKGMRYLTGKAVFTEDEIAIERRRHNLPMAVQEASC